MYQAQTVMTCALENMEKGCDLLKKQVFHNK